MERTIIIECGDCKGTGLYTGMAELGKCAVVCYHCKGTGKVGFTYNEFQGLRPMENVTRVFPSSFGYIHSDQDTALADGSILHFSNYGCTYEEWRNGVVPKPMEELYCPYVYQNHGIGCEPCSRCSEGCSLGTNIQDCKYFNDKANCWKEFHHKLKK